MVELSPQLIALTALSGAIVGVFLGAFGGGGSVLAAPLLIYLVGIEDTHAAIGTSAAAVAAIALFSLLGHWRGGRVKWPCATVFALAGLTGSLVGSTVAKSIQGDFLLLGFAIVMAAIAVSMFFKQKDMGNPDVTINLAIALRLVPIGLAVGLLAGFFGIGGGFLIVPGLMIAAGMTMANATASSLLSVTVFGSATSANYALSGFVDGRIVLILLLGGALGALIGIRIARALSTRARLARSAFAAMIMVVAGYVAWDAASMILSAP